MNIKKTHYFLLLVLVLVVFVISSNYKGSQISNVSNSATVANSTLEDSLNKVNAYTVEAENLADKINSRWTLVSHKKRYKDELKIALTNRKNLLTNFSSEIKPFVPLSEKVKALIVDKNLIEEQVSVIRGRIHTSHIDDFIGKKTTYKYTLTSSDGSKTYNLLIPNIGDLNGEITVSGFAFGKDLYSRFDRSKFNPHKTNNTENRSNENKNNTLVILVNFLNSQNNPFTVSEAQNLIFSGQFYKYMDQQSFGKAKFTGDVYGWVTVNKDDGGTCDISDRKIDLDQFAIANNINVKNYQHIAYVVNCSDPNIVSGTGDPAYNYELGGISANASVLHAYVGVDSALKKYLNGIIDLPFAFTNLDALLAHEMGHSLGLPHAEGLDCGSVATGASCIGVEYGNPFDVMGSGTFALHYNALYKKDLGWLGDMDVLSINKSGIYVLLPVEVSTGGAPQAFQLSGKRVAMIAPINQPNNFIYTLEYRKATGFDSQLKKNDKEGLYINKIGSDGRTYLIDAQPTNLPWLDDVGISNLAVNSVFTDPDTGLTIKSLGIDASGKFKFQVEMVSPPCNPMSPEIQDVFSAGLSVERAEVFVQASNKDSVGCLPSNFRTEILPNSIFSSLGSISSSSILPGEAYLQSTEPIYSDIKPGTLPGVYDVELKSTNLNTNLSSIKSFKVVVGQ